MTEYRLGSVDFASDVAREEAIAAQLTDADFADVEPELESGISVGQVREICRRITAEQKAAAEEGDYEVKRWLGHTSYHCRRCPFGTLDRAEIEAHVERPHAALTQTEG